LRRAAVAQKSVGTDRRFTSTCCNVRGLRHSLQKQPAGHPAVKCVPGGSLHEWEFADAKLMSAGAAWLESATACRCRRFFGASLTALFFFFFQLACEINFRLTRQRRRARHLRDAIFAMAHKAALSGFLASLHVSGGGQRNTGQGKKRRK